MKFSVCKMNCSKALFLTCTCTGYRGKFKSVYVTSYCPTLLAVKIINKHSIVSIISRMEQIIEKPQQKMFFCVASKYCQAHLKGQLSVFVYCKMKNP